VKESHEAKGALDGPAPVVPPSATGLWSSLARLATGLGIVCGLCVLAAKWFGQKPAPTPGAMEVLASIPVARCVVHLVRAGDRRLLIGTDLGGVKSLLELPGPEPAPVPTPEAAAAAAPSATDAESSSPAPAPPNREELLTLLAKLLARPGASPPA
jgi:flagellar biogenesis protein FliO